ncbi:PHD/YefM family antitoxin component YafN of YafNO toxin-antitoxin module [Methylobacterium sp. PvP062]|mgnify:CR=1 FL=1|uniref:PHD/YefM family antitoxin component YafN of YafNO toxin-antitoxin module n=1 Tax=Methylobacterium radiotolerans TaxID=31998 RepID=A0ABV2NTZ7_9HYPH|nr:MULTISPECIES: hypothetical protein [unclassified Methylobacterium]MBP2498346.1 PHD/YefM family antitoxin component YafN of YafNO toxin-antitoxin module [Methylobacterium sp. PvP105]MBP2505730.1 PHD/YefM family antitoxin component YafN of YafNO toxin-antitoxin module [Methylobacterium sp. PvP109]
MDVLEFSIEADVTEFDREPKFYRDKAHRKPVLVKEDGKPSTVVVDYSDFIEMLEALEAALNLLKIGDTKSDRQAYTIDNLPPDVAQMILEAPPSDLEEYEY